MTTAKTNESDGTEDVENRRNRKHLFPFSTSCATSCLFMILLLLNYALGQWTGATVVRWWWVHQEEKGEEEGD